MGPRQDGRVHGIRSLVRAATAAEGRFNFREGFERFVKKGGYTRRGLALGT